MTTQNFERDFQDKINKLAKELTSLNADYDATVEWLFENMLSVSTYKFDTNGEFCGVDVCIGFGGPNIYLEADVRTRVDYIKGYWGSVEVEAPFNNPYIFEYFEGIVPATIRQ